MKFRHLVSFSYICYFPVDFEEVLVKAEFIVCNDYVYQPRPQGAFSWLKRWGAPPPKPGKSALGTRLTLLHPIRSTTQIWVVTRHQYGISALVSQTSFHGETSGGVAKCRLIS